MNDFTDVYNTSVQFISAQNSLRYFFISQGKKDLIKIVDYSYVGMFNKFPLYNLAFGDFDPVKDEISDNAVSDNGDQYKVFHTVLHTVPMMFDALGQVSLIVEGSDSKPEFIKSCKVGCDRNCKPGECKKAHRRINNSMKKIGKRYETCAAHLVKVPEEGLLAMVATSLKDRVLFPEKLESAKKFMEKATFKVI